MDRLTPSPLHPHARTLRLVVLAFAVLLLSPGAYGQNQCTPTTSRPEVDTNTPSAARFYLDVDCPSPFCNTVFTVWIYQEDNGVEGLQRNDVMWDDTCNGQIPPDRLIF